MIHDPITVAPRFTQGGSLRQMDWRFLLPTASPDGFQHLVLLGGSVELAEQIVAIGLALQVSHTLPASSSIDAVISLQPASPSPADISRALRPGGVLYYELDQPLPASLLMSPTQLCNGLQGAGLSVTSIHWVRPDFARRQVYLPLENRAALRWYLTFVWRASTPLWRLGAFVMRVLAVVGHRPLARLAPRYAVTAVAGPTPTHVFPVSEHPAWPREIQRSDLRLLMLTPGQNDLNRVIMLPFLPTSRVPLAVFKYWRIPAFNPVIEHEQTALRGIHARLSEPLRQTIPRPFGVAKWGDLAVSGEQCVEGQALSTATNRSDAPSRRHLEDLRLVMTWLRAFQQQTMHRCGPWEAVDINQWVERPLEAYEQAFKLTASEARLFSIVRQRARELIGFASPIVWVHGDLALRNLRRNGQRLIVIDWEGSHLGPALFDLLFFITDWTKNARGLRDHETQMFSIRELFCDVNSSNWACLAAREAIAQHLNALSIDRQFLPLWVVLLWVRCALGRFELRDSVTPPQFVPETDNHHVEYIRQLSIHREGLFAG